jgi:two-component system, OmpR family, KDP operon response regulator KdpE
MSRRRILVVEDDPTLARALGLNLRARGYDVDVTVTGAQALTSATDHHPDVVVLDLGLPDMDGTDVIAGLRGWSSVPIVVLSARQSSHDKVDALDAGADDYVTKPFAMDELLARLRAAMRRGQADDEVDAVIATPAFTVDLAAKRVMCEGMVVRLTPTEWALLEILVRHPGQLVSQRELLRRVWGPAYEGETQYLRVYLGQLRRKLEPDPSRPVYLQTEPGMGYRFVLDS